jgi:superfamily II DNA or RNA helicase
MKEITLYKHNKETYDKVIEAWKTTNKVAVVQATGTGKSYIILKCLSDFIDKKKIVLAPSNYILEQLEWEGERLDNTELITYSKLSYMTDYEIEQLNPSLIILDEFHRCGAETWGNEINKLIERFPKSKILGTSATNIRFLDNNRDMAEELFEGNVVTNLTLAEAIVKNILPIPKYVSALYTFNDEINGLKNKVENSKNTDEDKEELLKEIEVMKNKLESSKGIPIILKKHLKDNNNYKFIVFCKDLEHLKEMKDIVFNWFKKSHIAEHIENYTAYSGYNDTNKEVEEFRLNKNDNTIKLLFSIDMFNEGIHIEDISGVILLRPTISPIIYYQQIGRAIQVGNGNNPIIFDFVNNFDNIGAKNFVGDLKEYAIIERNNNNKENSEDSNIDNYEFMIFDETQEAKTLFESIEDKLIDNWDSMYEELREFYNKNGHCNVSYSYGDNKKLYNWIRTQKKYGVSEEKKQKLDELNFDWELISFDDKWDSMYEKLLIFYNEYNDTNVPRTYNHKLWLWIGTQRSFYSQNRLTKDRIQKLEELNFAWNLIEENWRNMFKLLEEYYKKFGDTNVTRKYENKELFRWVAVQRRNYLNDKLSQDRIDCLNNINFMWSINETWDNMYNQLKSYYNKRGNTNVSIDENKKLYLWSQTQKKFFKKEKLDNEKIKKLNDINFSFKTKKDRWEVMYNLLVDYKKTNGNCDVEKDVIYKDKKLGYWVEYQRNTINSIRNNEEKETRIKKLNDINFLWKKPRQKSRQKYMYLKEDSWNDIYKCLIEYKEKFNTTKVPKGYKFNSINLGEWVRTQRNAYKKGNMNKERIDKLNNLGFIWKVR